MNEKNAIDNLRERAIDFSFGMAFDEYGFDKIIQVFSSNEVLKNWIGNRPNRHAIEKDFAIQLIEEYSSKFVNILVGSHFPVKGYIDGKGESFYFNLEEIVGNRKAEFLEQLSSHSSVLYTGFKSGFLTALEDCSKRMKMEVCCINFYKDEAGSAKVRLINDLGNFCYHDGVLSDYIEFLSEKVSLLNKLLRRNELPEEVSPARNLLLKLSSNITLAYKKSTCEASYIDGILNEKLVDSIIESNDSTALKYWLYIPINFEEKDAFDFNFDKIISKMESLLLKKHSADARMNLVIDERLISLVRSIHFKSKDQESKFFETASQKLLSLWSDAPISSALKETIKEILLSRSFNNAELMHELQQEKEFDLQQPKKRDKLRI